MENKEDRKITLELSEHDAFQLLTLVRKELNRSDKTWQPYWEAQIRKIQQFIEQASLPRRPIRPEDIFSSDDVDKEANGSLQLKGSF